MAPPKGPRKPRIAVTERDQQTDLDILTDPRYAARLQHPFEEPSSPIALKDSTRVCRWFNAAVARNSLSRTFATARSIRSRISRGIPTVWAVQ